jgi:DDE superfamily endonuclease
MWTMIASLGNLVEVLQPAFTLPSSVTSAQLLLGWVMCLGHHTLRRVAHTAHPEKLPDHSRRHGLDPYYNFFERSAWVPQALAYRVAVLILTRLEFLGGVVLLVDDTLAHKRGQSVWGLGWFRDAVASTKKRVATASGHNWVVLAVAVCLPGSAAPILALPLLARLHLPGKGQPSCPELARQMLGEVLAWFPGRRFTLVGDGAYATQALLDGLDERRRRGLRPARAQGQAGEARPEGQEGAAAAQPQGGGRQGRPQALGGGRLGVAGRVGDGVWLHPGAAGLRLRGRVAAGAGAAAGPGGGGARPGGANVGCVPVHHGPGGAAARGDYEVRLEVVH